MPNNSLPLSRFRALLSTGMLMAMVASAPAHAVLVPSPLPTDARIRTVVYSPNDVYPFLGHYGYQSFIEFDVAEKILTVSVGDSVAWQIVPSGHRLFIKPIEQDATTNMTVVTSKRTYFFELSAAETSDIRDPKMVFALRFVYPENQSLAMSSPLDTVPDPDLDDPAKYNFNYTITGPDDIAPIRIFDDGEFSYFEFRDKNAEVPAFFLVDSEGKESIINYRTRGNYIVVERVASRFTLRNGRDIVCVFNEKMPFVPAGPSGAPRKPGMPAPRAIDPDAEEKAEKPAPKEAQELPKEPVAENAKDRE